MDKFLAFFRHLTFFENEPSLGFLYAASHF